MTKKLDNFENLIKDKLNSQEFNYTPESWDALQQKLHPKKPFFKKPGNIAAIGLTALVATSLYIYSSVSTKNESNNVNTLANAKTPHTNLNNSTANTPENQTIQTENNSNLESTQQTVEVEHFVSSTNINKTKIQHTETKENSNALNQSETNNLSNEVNNKPTESIEPPKNSNVANLVEDSLSESNTTISDPIAAFYINQTTGCDDDLFSFNAIEQQNVTYTWFFGDGTTSKEIAPTHNYKKPGVYTIRLEVKSKLNTLSDVSEPQKVTVYSNPSLDFDFDIISENGIPYTHFWLNNSNNLADIQWNFGDGKVSNEITPTNLYRKKGSYMININATNDNGCKVELNQQVFIDEDYNLLAPNAFSPNGNGNNDDFMPAALELVAKSFTLTIYGQNGVIYETSNFNSPWDGTDKKGMNCLPGSYNWVVNLRTKDDKIEQYKGAILLIR